MTDFSKATPRPWRVRYSNDGSGDIGITADSIFNVLAECFSEINRIHVKETDVSHANAALIVEAVNSYDAMKARIAELEAAARNILPYLKFTIGPESPGHHPTMPSAVSAFEAALGKGGAG